jgi:predicted PurR-regulated permease PerM
MTDGQTPLWLRRWFQILLGSLLLLTVASIALPWLLGLVYALRSVLLPLVMALGLAYIFNPVVTWLHHRLRLPRAVGTAMVMLTALIAVLILALLILPPLIGQGVDLIQNAKGYPQKISQLIDRPSEAPVIVTASSTQPVEGSDQGLLGLVSQIRGEIEQALGPEQANEVLVTAANWLSEVDWSAVAQFMLSSLDVGAGVVGSAISFTSYLAISAVIIGFCFFFFSWKLDKLCAWFVPFIPASNQSEVLKVVRKMDKSVAAFIRGRLIQAGVMAVVLSIGWYLAGVPSWLLLGVLSGALNLVPFAAVVGFLAALSLAVVDSVAGGGFGLSVLVWPTVVYVLAQGLDGWVVEPIVQGKATDLDPVSVLVAVLIGGALAGLLGMLIAIPTAACVKIVSREIVLPRLRAMAAGRDYQPNAKS